MNTPNQEAEMHELLQQFGGPARLLLDKRFTQKQVDLVMAVIKTERYLDHERLVQRLEKKKLPEDIPDGEVENFIRLRVTAFNDGLSKAIQIIREEQS